MMPRLETTFRELERSLLLRVQLVRIVARWLRARLFLSLAKADASTDGVSRAARLARQIKGEGIHFADLFADLVEAAVAARRGQGERSEALLREASRRGRRSGMILHAIGAEWRLAERLGGVEGDTLRETAARWFSDEGVGSADNLCEVIAPGF